MLNETERVGAPVSREFGRDRISMPITVFLLSGISVWRKREKRTARKKKSGEIM